MINDEYYHFNRDRLKDRAIDEFVGICRGILADNKINNDEKNYLIEWLEKNRLTDECPTKEIYHFLKSNKDLDKIKELLLGFVGGKPPSDEIINMSPQLVLDTLDEPIVFEGKSFCLTGVLASAYGHRKTLEDEIRALGGICKRNIILSLDYLVVGEFGTYSWQHSNYGRKIEKAIEIRERPNSKLKIISEADLLKNL